MLCRVFYKAKGENSTEFNSQNNTTTHVTSPNTDSYSHHTTTRQPPLCGCYYQTTTNSLHQSPQACNHRQQIDYNHHEITQVSHNTSMQEESTKQMTLCSNTKCQNHESGFFSEFGFDFSFPSPMEFVDGDNEDNGIVFF